MTGIVTDELVPILEIRVFDQACSSVSIRVTVDTGFNGELALPPEILEGLGAPATGSRRIRIGDGSWIWLPTHEVELEWETTRFVVTCLATPNCHLLGMALLLGYVATVESMPQGRVGVEPIHGN